MRLYLVQHGLAVPKDVDPDRPLTEQGRRDVRQLAELLDRAGVRASQVLHSGKSRAEETAAVLARSLMPTGRVQAQRGLNPDDPVQPFAERLSTWTADTLVVGHMPFLGHLASLLLTGDADRVTVAFAPGSLVCLERDAQGDWGLTWMIRPELLHSRGD